MFFTIYFLLGVGSKKGNDTCTCIYTFTPPTISLFFSGLFEIYSPFSTVPSPWGPTWETAQEKWKYSDMRFLRYISLNKELQMLPSPLP